MKKYYYTIAIVGIFLATLGIIVLNQNQVSKLEVGKKVNLGTLAGAPLKVPIYDKNTITLSGSTMNFVDVETKKPFALEFYGNIMKTEDTQLLPLKLTGEKIKDKYLFVSFIKQDGKWIQKQGVLFGIDVKNIDIQLKERILTVNFDKLDKEEKLVHTIQYFKIDQGGHFSLYYPNIDNGSMGLEIITNTWKWKKTSYSTGAIIIPKKDVFTLKMDENGKFTSKTDCNSLAGNFSVAGNGSAHFSDMISTMMACPESQETDYSKMLEDVKSFSLSGSTLTLGLKTNSGSMLFEAQAKK